MSEAKQYQVTVQFPAGVSAQSRSRGGISVDREAGYVGPLSKDQLAEIETDPYLTVADYSDTDAEGEQASEIVANANSQAEQIIADATDQANAAKEEAERVSTDAKAKGEEAISAAQEQAKKIIADAEAEAKKMKEAAAKK